MGLALGTNLKFYISLSKGLILKVRKFWGLIPTFVEVTGEKLVGVAFWPTPLPPILNRVKNEFVDLAKSLLHNSGKLIPLSPFVKDGLFRVGGRIGSAYIPYSSKHQVVISNNHPIASLLVFYIHVTNFHQDVI